MLYHMLKTNLLAIIHSVINQIPFFFFTKNSQEMKTRTVEPIDEHKSCNKLRHSKKIMVSDVAES